MIAGFVFFGGAVCGWVLNNWLRRRIIERFGFDAYREKYYTDYF